MFRGEHHKPCAPDHPRVPFEPMSEPVEPFLALSATRVADTTGWAFEMKWMDTAWATHIEAKGASSTARLDKRVLQAALRGRATGGARHSRWRSGYEPWPCSAR
jgi:hypothetical protein